MHLRHGSYVLHHAFGDVNCFDIAAQPCFTESMIAFFLIVLPFLLQLFVLSLVAHKLNDLLYRRLGKFLYLVFMIPGVMVHELSHFAGCLVTFTRVTGLHLFDPHEEAPGTIVLGRVEHVQPRTWFASVLIGSAPFFGGSLVLWLLLRWFVPDITQNTNFSALTLSGGSIIALLREFGNFWGSLLSSLDWGTWQTYLFLYLVLAVGSHLVPSSTDRKNMLWALIGGVVLLVLAVWLAVFIGPNAQTTLLGWIAQTVGALSVLLSYALCLVLLAAIFLGGLSVLIGWLRKRTPKNDPRVIPPPQNPL